MYVYAYEFTHPDLVLQKYEYPFLGMRNTSIEIVYSRVESCIPILDSIWMLENIYLSLCSVMQGVGFMCCKVQHEIIVVMRIVNCHTN